MLLTLLLLACNPDPSKPSGRESDTGGPVDTGDPSDCPEPAEEVCDGVDNDCDGLIDDDDPGVAERDQDTWYTDQDGDGYGTDDSAILACEPPYGNAVLLGGDCDDDDDEVNPGEREVCDDLDNDCDALVDDDDDSLDTETGEVFYEDADGDGYGDPDRSSVACTAPDGFVETGEDCDPSEASVHPDASDPCGDGIDADCDGEDRVCGGLSGELDPTEDYTVAIYASVDTEVLGASFAILDWDGDGVEDVAIGASGYDDYDTDQGAVWIFTGPLASGAYPDDEGYATAIFGTTDNARVGGIVDQVGDLDGDGDDELYVFSSTSSTSARKEQGIVLGGATGDYYVTDVLAYNVRCYGATSGGDPDGDGTHGWVCGEGGNTLNWYEGLDTTVSDAIDGSSSTSGFGNESVADQDLDGDGVEDLWVAAPNARGGASYSGAVYVFEGPFTSTTYVDADATLLGTDSSDNLGYKLAVTDLDGDGTPDLLAGTPGDDTLATDGGAWSAWYGPIDSTTLSTTADVAAYGYEDETGLGGDILGAADLDGDGQTDLSFSSNAAPGGAVYGGEVWVVYGPCEGTLSLADAETEGAHLEGAADNDYLGNGSHLGADLTGDGTPELVFGAYGMTWPGTDTDGVLLVFQSE